MEHSAVKKEEDTSNERDDEQSREPSEMLQFLPELENVWLLKLPKSLIETWKQVEQPGVELGTIRIFDKKMPNGRQKISLLLPSNPAYEPSSSNSRMYDVELTSLNVHSQYLVADTPKPPPVNHKRARTTVLRGRIANHASVRPSLTSQTAEDIMGAKLRRRIAEVKAARPSIKRDDQDDTKMVRGEYNRRMLQTGGATSANGTFDTSRSKASATSSLPIGSKGPKAEFERAARVGKDRLLDVLFELFAEMALSEPPQTVVKAEPVASQNSADPSLAYLSMKTIRSKTAQPESYLREVLSEIADFHRHGPHVNTYSLKKSYLDLMKNRDPNSTKREDEHSQEVMDVDADDDDEDDDEEMEEIA